VKRHRPVLLCAALWALALINVGALADAQPASPTSKTQGHQLIGAWQLERIEVITPDGVEIDPFYGAHPRGTILYDAAGWMSVQIEGADRPRLEAAPERSAAEASRNASRKAAAYDTYYAYVGTWEYDESTGSVTHRVRHALIPGEVGLQYTQGATVEGEQLVFTTRSIRNGVPITRRKIWHRVAGSP
jgi:Lipocalin-like domain